MIKIMYMIQLLNRITKRITKMIAEKMHNSGSDFPGCLIYKNELVDDLRGDFHHSEQGRSSCHAITKTPYSWFFCVVAILPFRAGGYFRYGDHHIGIMPTSRAILRFALSSASYRAGLRQWCFRKNQRVRP